MKTHYPVVIIGGGPAGSSAAYHLSAQGIDVCLIDKSRFPRDKLCAGLLTVRSKHIFEQIFASSWEETYEYKSNTLKFYYENQHLNSAENYSEVYLTYRSHFDHYLLERAKQNGATIELGQAVNAIDLQNKYCLLHSGKRLGYDYLIAADGVNSIAAKTLFGASFDKRTIGFALEMEVERKNIAREVTAPEIFMGTAAWGYAWIFPKRDYVTVGIMGLHQKNPDLKANFLQFMENQFGEVPAGKIKGHYIPFGDYRKKLGADNLLLAGDAAGFADPMSGEGIAYAMQSGLYAAEAVVESIKTGQDPVKIYTQKCRPISRSFAFAKVLSYTLFHPVGQHIYKKLLPRKNDLQLRHMDVLADKIGYSTYTRHVITAILNLYFLPFYRR